MANKKTGLKAKAAKTSGRSAAIAVGSNDKPPAQRKKGGGKLSRPATAFAAPALPKYLLAQIDPFNSTAEGAKIPDQDLTWSSTCYSETEVTLATDATYGLAAALFYPDPSSDQATGTANATTNWGLAANWTSQSSVPNITAIRAAYGLLRCVAWGVRFYCPGAVGTTVGRVHVCLVPIDYGTTGYTTACPTSVSTMMQLPGYQNWPLQDLIQDTVMVTGRMTDLAGAYRYRDAAVPWNVGSAQVVAGVETSAGWYGIMIVVEGAGVSQNVVSVEVRKHYEAQIKGNTGAGVLHTTPGAPYQPTILAASNNIVANVPPARIMADSGNSERQLWKDIEGAWKTGVQIANGVGDAVAWAARIAGMFI